LILVAAFLPAWQAANGSAAANSSVAAADLGVLHRRAVEGRRSCACGLHMRPECDRLFLFEMEVLLCMPKKF